MVTTVNFHKWVRLESHVKAKNKVTHVPSTSLNSNISLISSTCFFHEQSPPASPFSRAMVGGKKHTEEDRRWRSERWRSPEIFPAFPRCTSCSFFSRLPRLYRYQITPLRISRVRSSPCSSLNGLT